VLCEASFWCRFCRADVLLLPRAFYERACDRLAAAAGRQAGAAGPLGRQSWVTARKSADSTQASSWAPPSHGVLLGTPSRHTACDTCRRRTRLLPAQAVGCMRRVIDGLAGLAGSSADVRGQRGGKRAKTWGGGPRATPTAAGGVARVCVDCFMQRALACWTEADAIAQHSAA
jgi:hypothetical protein